MTADKVRERIQMAGAVASIGVLVLVPWMFTVERRVTSIESNRFTQHDGLVLWQKISELPLNSPLNKVNVIEEKVDRMATDLTQLNFKIFDSQTLESRLSSIEGNLSAVLETLGDNQRDGK